MSTDELVYSNIFQEEMGAMNNGDMKISKTNIQYKNKSTGRVHSINAEDIKEMKWQSQSAIGGFKEAEFSKISSFCSSNWSKEVEKSELCMKGWNYGDARFEGQNLVFQVDNKVAFEFPLTNVARCVGNKSENTIEFAVNEECPVQLVEMRLHVPQDPDQAEDVDMAEEFRKAVMKFAEAEDETDQPLVMLSQIYCATPRGRYDIKVFQNHLSFHGKTYDYKIPFKSITRMFLLPHKDGRHMFLSCTLTHLFARGSPMELGVTDEQLKTQYNNKLERNMQGLLYEIMAKLFRVLVNIRIIVPGNFTGASGTPAVSCALRQASGYLYPLEKGFVYVHKPPLYIRFEEIDNVHFARSDLSTRSFDFEIVQKAGSSVLFSSVSKEEYNKLFDYVSSKGLKIRNATRMGDKPSYKEDKFADSGDELDPYKEGLKREAANRSRDDDGSESDSEDEDYDMDEDIKKKQKEKESSEGSGSEPDEEYDSNDSGESAVSDDIANSAKKEAKRKSEGGKKEKKKQKDPNAPKRGQTAFFIWMQENRQRLKKEGDSVAETAQRAGHEWKSMTEDDKKPYEKRAKEDKERYERESKEYAATQKSNPTPSKPSTSKPKFVEDDSDDSDDSAANKKKKAKDAKKEVATSSSKSKKSKAPAAKKAKDDSDESSAAASSAPATSEEDSD
uniref:FACT complex subunit SSRP1 n=1 Tax=Ditylenchus dipsaci TaxID=166011 RepID=A0A915E3A0_9BILA